MSKLLFNTFYNKPIWCKPLKINFMVKSRFAVMKS